MASEKKSNRDSIKEHESIVSEENEAGDDNEIRSFAEHRDQVRRKSSNAHKPVGTSSQQRHSSSSEASVSRATLASDPGGRRRRSLELPADTARSAQSLPVDHNRSSVGSVGSVKQLQRRQSLTNAKGELVRRMSSVSSPAANLLPILGSEFAGATNASATTTEGPGTLRKMTSKEEWAAAIAPVTQTVLHGASGANNVKILNRQTSNEGGVALGPFQAATKEGSVGSHPVTTGTVLESMTDRKSERGLEKKMTLGSGLARIQSFKRSLSAKIEVEPMAGAFGSGATPGARNTSGRKNRLFKRGGEEGESIEDISYVAFPRVEPEIIDLSSTLGQKIIGTKWATRYRSLIMSHRTAAKIIFNVCFFAGYGIVAACLLVPNWTTSKSFLPIALLGVVMMLVSLLHNILQMIHPLALKLLKFFDVWFFAGLTAAMYFLVALMLADGRVLTVCSGLALEIGVFGDALNLASRRSGLTGALTIGALVVFLTAFVFQMHLLGGPFHEYVLTLRKESVSYSTVDLLSNVTATLLVLIIRQLVSNYKATSFGKDSVDFVTIQSAVVLTRAYHHGRSKASRMPSGSTTPTTAPELSNTAVKSAPEGNTPTVGVEIISLPNNREQSGESGGPQQPAPDYDASGGREALNSAVRSLPTPTITTNSSEPKHLGTSGRRASSSSTVSSLSTNEKSPSEDNPRSKISAALSKALTFKGKRRNSKVDVEKDSRDIPSRSTTASSSSESKRPHLALLRAAPMCFGERGNEISVRSTVARSLFGPVVSRRIHLFIEKHPFVLWFWYSGCALVSFSCTFYALTIPSPTAHCIQTKDSASLSVPSPTSQIILASSGSFDSTKPAAIAALLATVGCQIPFFLLLNVNVLKKVLGTFDFWFQSTQMHLFAFSLLDMVCWDHRCMCVFCLWFLFQGMLLVDALLPVHRYIMTRLTFRGYNIFVTGAAIIWEVWGFYQVGFSSRTDLQNRSLVVLAASETPLGMQKDFVIHTFAFLGSRVITITFLSMRTLWRAYDNNVSKDADAFLFLRSTVRCVFSRARRPSVTPLSPAHEKMILLQEQMAEFEKNRTTVRQASESGVSAGSCGSSVAHPPPAGAHTNSSQAT